MEWVISGLWAAMLEEEGGQEFRYPSAEVAAAPPISRQTALTARASLLFPWRRQSAERRGGATVGLQGGRWFMLPKVHNRNGCR